MRRWEPWETSIYVDPDNFDPPIFGEPQFFDRNLRAIERVLATTRFGPWTQFQTTNSVYVLRKHGMPFRAFSSWEVEVGGPGAGKVEHFSSIGLPIGYLGKRVNASLRPLPFGLTANILTWSVVSFAVFEGVHAMRRLVRRRRGRCVACGYSRHGLNAADPCPECGASSAAKPAAAPTPIG